MRIAIRLKPYVMTAKTKDELMELVRQKYGLYWTCSSQGKGYESLKDEKQLGINLEKRRRKVLVRTDGQREVIRKAHWIAWVYILPSMVKRVQHERFFRMEVIS